MSVCVLTMPSGAGYYSYPLPNKLNASFDYPSFLYFILATYPLGFYKLYFYMIRQRGKVLGGKVVKAKGA